MKPAHESALTLVTTAQQCELIDRLMKKHLDEGGGVLAQVFSDGFRVRVLTPAQARALHPAICLALGTPEAVNTIRHSAFGDSQDKGGAA